MNKPIPICILYSLVYYAIFPFIGISYINSVLMNPEISQFGSWLFPVLLFILTVVALFAIILRAKWFRVFNTIVSVLFIILTISQIRQWNSGTEFLNFWFYLSSSIFNLLFTQFDLAFIHYFEPE